MAAKITRFRLGDRCTVKSSKRVFAEEYVEAGIPFLRSKDVIDKSLGVFQRYDLFISEKRYRELKETHGSPKKGDLLISSVGNRSGQPYVIRDEGDFYFKDGNILWLSDFKELDPTCLSYWLKSDRGQHSLSSVMIGSAQKALTIDAIRNLSVDLPSFADQRAIAAVLGVLDDKIELNRRMNAALEAMARALFQSWFVDFDPVRAKQEGCSPTGLDEPTTALFPATFQTTRMGEIPKEWEVCPLSEKIELLNGGTPKTSEPSYWNGDIPWYSVKDAPSDSDVWVIQTEKTITQQGIDHSATQLLPEGTTIISARGTVGKLALAGRPMAMNQSCYGIRGREGYSDAFIYFLLRQVTGDLQKRTHGSVFDTITRQTFSTIDYPFPPVKLAIAFSIAVKPTLNRIRANLHESYTLATLRDTLLPKMLSGDVRIPIE